MSSRQTPGISSRQRVVLVACRDQDWFDRVEKLIEQTPISLRHTTDATDLVGPANQQLERYWGYLLTESLIGSHIEDACHCLREADRSVVVVAVQAKDDVEQECRLISMGVDDVLKPTAPARLAAVRLLRRIQQRGWPCDTQEVPTINNVRIDLVNGYAFRDGQQHRVTPTEAMILRYMMTRANQVVSRQEFLTSLWPESVAGPEGKAVDVHISRLRQLLEDNPRQPSIIETVRGAGYRLVLPPDHPAIPNELNID